MFFAIPTTHQDISFLYAKVNAVTNLLCYFLVKIHTFSFTDFCTSAFHIWMRLCSGSSATVQPISHHGFISQVSRYNVKWIDERYFTVLSICSWTCSCRLCIYTLQRCSTGKWRANYWNVASQILFGFFIIH